MLVDRLGCGYGRKEFEDMLIRVAGGSGHAELTCSVDRGVSVEVPLGNCGGLAGGGGGCKFGVEHAAVAGERAASPTFRNDHLFCYGGCHPPECCVEAH